MDRAYVDKKFNGQNWFLVREKALKDQSMETRQETYEAIRKARGSPGQQQARCYDTRVDGGPAAAAEL